MGTEPQGEKMKPKKDGGSSNFKECLRKALVRKVPPHDRTGQKGSQLRNSQCGGPETVVHGVREINAVKLSWGRLSIPFLPLLELAAPSPILPSLYPVPSEPGTRAPPNKAGSS